LPSEPIIDREEVTAILIVLGHIDVELTSADSSGSSSAGSQERTPLAARRAQARAVAAVSGDSAGPVLSSSLFHAAVRPGRRTGRVM
jgi:hypothetical protein